MKRALFLLVLLAMPSQLRASNIVSFEFTATVVAVDDPSSVLGGSVVVGNPMAGTVFWDLNTPVTPFLPDTVSYIHPPASSLIGGLDIDTGGIHFSRDPTENFDVAILNDATRVGVPPFDSISVFAPGQSPHLPPMQFLHLNWRLTDHTAQALPDLSLPTSIDLNGFDAADVTVSGQTTEGQQFFLSGSIDSVTPVPEPSSLIGMVSLGLVGLGACRRRGRVMRR